MAEMTIRRVGVLSLARIQGLLMLVIGLIIGVIYGLIHNALAGVVGGIKSDLEGTMLSAYVPPPPQPWSPSPQT